MAKRFVRRRNIQTKTEIDTAKWILNHIERVGNGCVIDVGIQPEDFDKVPVYPNRNDSLPVGIYAAHQVFGNAKSPPRDFMSRSFFNSIDKYIDLLKNYVMLNWNNSMTIHQMNNAIGRYLAQEMQDTLKNYGGKPNSQSWSQYKLKNRLQKDVLRATDTMLNSIKHKEHKADKPSLTRYGVYKLFIQSYNRNIRRMKDVHRWVYKISN